ncbi:MAG: topoisomerase DNA-binding C4 zinc finger domain-containing protein [Actinobacteria bacterium]|nr:topoisomerase DNA-binding C4 zinc finger domain-containing protein [Actinomycetota bacterium]
MLRRWRQRRLFERLASEEAARARESLAEVRKALADEHEAIRRELRQLPGLQTCPECGSQLVLRVARKGRRSGTGFWGCRRWPACRYAASVNSHPDPRIVRHELA